MGIVFVPNPTRIGCFYFFIVSSSRYYFQGDFRYSFIGLAHHTMNLSIFYINQGNKDLCLYAGLVDPVGLEIFKAISIVK